MQQAWDSKGRLYYVDEFGNRVEPQTNLNPFQKFGRKLQTGFGNLERWLNETNPESQAYKDKAALTLGVITAPIGGSSVVAGNTAKALTPYVGRKIGEAIATSAVGGATGGAIEGFGRGLLDKQNPFKTAAIDASIGLLGGSLLGLGSGQIGKLLDRRNLKKAINQQTKLSNNYYRDYERGVNTEHNLLGRINLQSDGFKETNAQSPEYYDKVIDLSKNLRNAEYLHSELPKHDHKYKINLFHRLKGNDVDYLIAQNDKGKKYFHKVTSPEVAEPKSEPQGLYNSIINDTQNNFNLSEQYYKDYLQNTNNEKEQLREFRKYLADIKGKTNPETLNNEIPLTKTEAFKNWSGDTPMVSSKEALDYPFKTGQGVTVEGYHGTKRGDRVGEEFKPERATSGPMAFFSSNKEIAEGYARNKIDTSLAEEMSDYGNWFKYRDKQGNLKPLSESWYDLTPQERVMISKNAPHITFDENVENIIFDPNINYGTGNYDYAIKSNKNNHLKALIDEWLQSGNLYGNEGDFYKVLEKTGINMDNVDYIDPYADHSKVYDVFLSMKKPLVTNDIPNELLERLATEAPNNPAKIADGYGVDMWDKNSRDGVDWINTLKEDIAKGENSHAWTSIPDWVTEELKKSGYDGIIDVGGKSGGEIHKVYIPFEPTQIKSVNNQGTFDPTNPNIYKSLLPFVGGGLFELLKNKDNKEY